MTALSSSTWHLLVRLAGRPLAALVWLLVGAGFAALISAGHYYLFEMRAGGDWQGMLMVKLIVWTIWIPFALATLELANRFPLEKPHVIRHLLIQLILTTALTGLYLLCYASILFVLARLPRPFALIATLVMRDHSTYYLLAGWAIVMLENLLHYADQLNLRDRREEKLRLQMERARLDAIHARLRPHFLFNALNSISSLIVRGNREEANDTVASLADLLRATLDRTNDGLVPLREELRLIDRYLDIVKRRFHDRLIVSLDFSETTLPIRVPSFILQNLVENAVKHGVEKAGGNISLELTGQIEGDHLNLTVANSLPSGRLEGPADGSGFGLKSIHDRLKAYYGTSYSFESSGAEGRFVVSLSIPTQPESEANDA